LGRGVFGGKLINHFDQGSAAAAMAVEIFNGRPIEEMKVITKNTNKYLFDYAVMDQLGIDQDDLPEGSRIINTPHSIYKAHKKAVWTIGVIFTIFIILILLLSLNILNRLRAEKELKEHKDFLEDIVEKRTAELTELNKALIDSEERFHCLSDAAFEGVAITEDSMILEMNDSFCNMLGYSPAELINKPVVDFIASEEKKSLKSKIFHCHMQTFESLCLRKDSSVLPIEVQAKEFSYKGKDVMAVIFRDISERKQAEEEISKLKGILPVCSFCKKVRDDKGNWEQIDTYIDKYSEADISHSVCPECLKKHYPTAYDKM